MSVSLINIGYGNMVVTERIIAVIQYDSAPAKRITKAAETSGLLINSTQGRKSRSVIIMDDRHVILSAVQTETLANRLNNRDLLKSNDQELDNEN